MCGTCQAYTAPYVLPTWPPHPWGQWPLFYVYRWWNRQRLNSLPMVTNAKNEKRRDDFRTETLKHLHDVSYLNGYHPSCWALIIRSAYAKGNRSVAGVKKLMWPLCKAEIVYSEWPSSPIRRTGYKSGSPIRAIPLVTFQMAGKGWEELSSTAVSATMPQSLPLSYGRQPLHEMTSGHQQPLPSRAPEGRTTPNAAGSASHCPRAHLAAQTWL